MGDFRNELTALLEEAVTFYHDYLLADCAKEAYTHLQNRGFNPGFLYCEQIGYAPGGHVFCDEFLRRGYPERNLVAAGLIEPNPDFPNRSHNEFRDLFANRILFPLRNLEGILVGLGARVPNSTSENGSKYTVKENTLFKKDDILYGLDRAIAYARKTGNKKVVIVDSYTDALMAWQEGIENVVGLCKTTLTAQLVGELRKYFDTITVAINPGKIKRKTPAAAVMLMRHGILPRVAELPGKDFDEFLADEGARATLDLLTHSASLYDFVYRHTTKNLPEHVDVNAAQVVLRQLAPFFNHAESPAQKQLYLEETVKRLGVSRQVVNAYLAPGKKRSMIPVDITGTAPAELEVLANLLQRHAFAHTIQHTFEPNDFTNKTYRALFAYLTTEVFDALSNGSFDKTDAQQMPLFFKQKTLTTAEILATTKEDVTEAELAQAITLMNVLPLYTTTDEAILNLQRVHKERDLSDLASRIRALNSAGQREGISEKDMLTLLQTYANKEGAYRRLCKELDSLKQSTSPEEPSSTEQPA